MAKSQEHLEAVKMRGAGKSIKDIARTLGVSKSSASLWCADVKLTRAQLDHLRKQMSVGGYEGRLRGALMQKNRKELKIREYEHNGLREIGAISSRDLLLLGIGLHLGEGTKAGNKFRFTNSNPGLIRLMALVLKRYFDVNPGEFVLTVFVNEAHATREGEIKRFWAKATKAALGQFRKTIFIKAKRKKTYANFNDHYGTLALEVRKSSDLQYKILGLCYGVLRSTKNT